MNAYSASVTPDLSELAGLRHDLARWFERAAVGKELGADLVLATHEAVANAIEHAEGQGRVAVKANLSEGEITIDVTNQGAWKSDQRTDISDRGRGLLLMRALADDVVITSSGDAVTVSVRRSLGRNHSATSPSSTPCRAN